VVNGVGETSSRIGATSSRVIVRETRNRVRETSSAVVRKVKVVGSLAGYIDSSPVKKRSTRRKHAEHFLLFLPLEHGEEDQVGKSRPQKCRLP
jgi:hypothetical protein